MIISRITFTVLSYATEDESKVQLALLNCVPIEFRNSKVTIQRLQSQFQDKLIIQSLVFQKKKSFGTILGYLSSKIENKATINENFEQILDMEDRTLHLRFDKFRALDEILLIANGNDIIKCEISYATYEQHLNTMENVQKLFREIGLIV